MKISGALAIALAMLHQQQITGFATLPKLHIQVTSAMDPRPTTTSGKEAIVTTTCLRSKFSSNDPLSAQERERAKSSSMDPIQARERNRKARLEQEGKRTSGGSEGKPWYQETKKPSINEIIEKKKKDRLKYEKNRDAIRNEVKSDGKGKTWWYENKKTSIDSVRERMRSQNNEISGEEVQGKSLKYKSLMTNKRKEVDEAFQIREKLKQKRLMYEQKNNSEGSSPETESEKGTEKGNATNVRDALKQKRLMYEQRLIPEQGFLEADPYWNQSEVPVNNFTNKAPFVGKVVSTKRIVGPKATGETCHIVIDHDGAFPYWEGQSWGVIPPGTREKDGKPHSARLYSIASSRYGDDMSGTTGSLCVRRATYWCPELKAEDPSKKGICSNFLCDTKPGDEIQMTGPAGKVMLMPEEDPDTDLIMVATGTGIAPYRGFIRRLFLEDTPAARAYQGQAWLFLGVANSDALLYDDEWQEIMAEKESQFRVDYALSREQTNRKGGKMYIQDKVEEYSDHIFDKLDNGAHIYFCGLKGMMPGIQEMLKSVCDEKGIDYDEWIKGLKADKRWHVEVY